MKKSNLEDFNLTNNLLNEINGGNSNMTPIQFNGENAVQEASALADCYCWCSCGWSGTGTGTGWITPELQY